MSVRLGLFGADGHMGRRVQACVVDHPGLALVVLIDQGSPAALNFGGCDVVIDFSVAPATAALLGRLEDSEAALVTGTTGRTPEQREAVAERALRAPLFEAANFSVGVNVLAHVVEVAARALAGFEAEVFEIHHRRKVDAPSGTALFLAEAAARGQGLVWPEGRAPVRDGATGPRGTGEVGIAALRGGDVVGEHTAYFFGAAERVELTHRATDRDVFAHGALRAARFVAEREPGHYDMLALLGLTGR